jgi:hypothetical protein
MASHFERGGREDGYSVASDDVVCDKTCTEMSQDTVASIIRVDELVVKCGGSRFF